MATTKGFDTEAPAEASDVIRRPALTEEGRAPAFAAPIADLDLPSSAALRIECRHGRWRVLVESDGHPIPSRGDERIEAVGLRPRDLKGLDLPREARGVVPPGARTTFFPGRARQAGLPIPDDDEDRDPGGTIFGADDRYLYRDLAFPWRTVGQVRSAVGRCTGTMIGPRHVLTASHCVNWDGDGGAGWISFSPGYFDGDRPWGEHFATQIVYWIQAPPSLTDAETSRDYVVLVLEDRLGEVVGYPGYRTYNDGWNGGSFWQYTGYPGELSSGERPAFQNGCVVSSDQSGAGGGLVLGHFNEFTPGQSGGSCWGWWGDEPWPRVVGVGSTIGSTAVQTPTGSTSGDNEYGGGEALSDIIGWARTNFA